jgi:hypothetical protein
VGRGSGPCTLIWDHEYHDITENNRRLGRCTASPLSPTAKNRWHERIVLAMGNRARRTSAYSRRKARSPTGWDRSSSDGRLPTVPHRWRLWRSRGADEDGVMVISAWTDGAGGGFLARVTMSRAIAEPQVRVVASAEEALAIVGEWLDELCE